MDELTTVSTIYVTCRYKASPMGAFPKKGYTYWDFESFIRSDPQRPQRLRIPPNPTRFPSIMEFRRMFSTASHAHTHTQTYYYRLTPSRSYSCIHK